MCNKGLLFTGSKNVEHVYGTFIQYRSSVLLSNITTYLNHVLHNGIFLIIKILRSRYAYVFSFLTA